MMVTVKLEPSNELIELEIDDCDAERVVEDSAYLKTLVDAHLERQTLEMLAAEKAEGDTHSGEGHGTDDVTKERMVEGPKEENAFIWTDQTVLLLLSLYEEREAVFKSGVKRHSKIWAEIAAEMTGYKLTGSQCQTKLHGLKRRYKIILDHNNKSGNDRRTWPFFDVMENIFGNKKWVKPLSVATEAGPSAAENSTSSPKILSDSPVSSKTKRQSMIEHHLESLKEERKKEREEKEKRREDKQKRQEEKEKARKELIDEQKQFRNQMLEMLQKFIEKK